MRRTRQTSQRLLLAAAVTTAIVLTTASAHAGRDSPDLGFLYAAILLEPFVPDTRLEFDDSKVFANLSWPLPHLDAYHLFGSKVDSEDELWPTLFVEPQWRPADGQFRFLGGSRLRFASVPLFVEGAGLLGSDGHGGTAGLGLTARRSKELGFLSLVYRHTWTNQGQRDDIGFDLLFYVL